MLEKFFPDFLIDSVYNIELETLLKNNIKGLILDIDNTLVAMHVKEADERVVKWIERVRDAGLKACIVSNASQTRVVKFNDRLKLFAIHRASKPGSKGFIKAVKYMGIKPEEAAVIGDQLFTDIYGGNRINSYTVLVKPIDEREILFIRLKRLPEKIIMRKYTSGVPQKTEIKRKEWKKASARRILGYNTGL